MFLDKPINGHGYNSFQIKCKKYEKITNTNEGIFRGCSTHPHNAFLEILAEQGLIGFLILIVIIFYILNKIFTLKFKSREIKIKFILSGILFLCFLFSFKTYWIFVFGLVRFYNFFCLWFLFILFGQN